jgi:ssDNA thymidine ADP-ribosyltransferase, DarT
VDNLAGIVADGELLSDARMIARGGPARAIGMSAIKRRRVEELEVPCHPGTKVGDYVPFYFCPRSVMLFVIHRANHPELAFRGGQDSIAHLEADLRTVVAWAEDAGQHWAFSLSNAGAYYTEFRSRLGELDQLDWVAISATDFRTPNVKESKQAEFLLYERCPFHLIGRIGVRAPAVASRAHAAVARATHRPVVEVIPQWYF